MPSLATLPAEDQIDPDPDLVRRAGRGDSRAFEALYRRHSGRVYGLCVRLTGDRAGAEDCTQEAFINAWRALPKFESRSGFGTWLYRIAVNVVMKKRRKRSGHEQIVPDAEQLLESQWQFDTPVELSEIEAAIAALPDGARDALVLSGIYGYSSEETAEMLDIAEGTCRAQLHRARKLMRQSLQVEVC